MSTQNMKVQSVLENTFHSVIEELLKDQQGVLISDLYVQVDQENGELQIYDDQETLLGKTIIFDWVNSNDQEEEFTKTVTASLKAALTILATKEVFENPRFSKPFSISLTNENFIVTDELLFLDDDTFRLDDPLLKDLDEELDTFLEQLLSDIE